MECHDSASNSKNRRPWQNTSIQTVQITFSELAIGLDEPEDPQSRCCTDPTSGIVIQYHPIHQHPSLSDSLQLTELPTAIYTTAGVQGGSGQWPGIFRTPRQGEALPKV